MSSRSIARGLAVLALAGIGGCDGGDEDGGPVRFLAGRVDAEVYVAIVADDRDVVVYACDGTADEVTITEWFQGTHDGGHFDLTSMRTGGHAVGDFDDDAGSGTLHTGSAALTFTLDVAEDDAGLYFDEVVEGDADHWGGWVVLPDGSLRGSVLNRKTGAIVAAGDATPGGRITVSMLGFDVQRLRTPAI